jgi:hypothetical protein
VAVEGVTEAEAVVMVVVAADLPEAEVVVMAVVAAVAVVGAADGMVGAEVAVGVAVAAPPVA